MAPLVPEEVDVFSVPHSRMRVLVHDYSQLLQTTNFSNDVDHQILLENLYRTFVEFKTHEQIENKFIMRKLKAKLKRLSIQHSAVCNCHKDNVLLDMLGFIKDGFKKKTEQDRINYGRRLKQALENFTNNFLPHMKEEEEVFQPLLLQHFTYEELCELKKNVISQHIMRKSISEETEVLEKWTQENAKEDSASDSEDELLARAAKAQLKTRATFLTLPPEIILKIFSHLNPRDLCRAAQVCKDWNRFCLDPALWPRILPVQWARGNWSFQECQVERDEALDALRLTCRDDDADIDESGRDDELLRKLQHESRVLHGVCHHLLPRVGSGVHAIHLSQSKALSSCLTQTLLKFCPNVRHLDLSYTKVADSTFKSVSRTHGLSQLLTLDLSGCPHINDAALVNLAMAMIPKLSPSESGCHSVAMETQLQQTFAEECFCEELYRLCEQFLSLRRESVDKNKRRGEVNDRAVSAVCHSCCGQDSDYTNWQTVENCLPSRSLPRVLPERRCQLLSLSLSGCFQVTDLGLKALSLSGLFPRLSRLDLSGCFLLTGEGLHCLVDHCPALLPCDLFYCDNILDGPYTDSASGCQNLECSTRVCCRSGD